jgi:ATP-dependent DNA helicase RecG
MEAEESPLHLGKRARPDQVRTAILSFCHPRPKTATEIAEHVGRNQQYITYKYLTPLVRHGELLYTNPELPTHPDQQYQTANR